MDTPSDSYSFSSLLLSNGLSIAKKAYRWPARKHGYCPEGGMPETASCFAPLERVQVEIWLEIVAWVIGDRAGVEFDMNTGTMACTDPDLLSISAASRYFRELSRMVHISHRIILRYTHWDEWKRTSSSQELGDFDSPVPEQWLDVMKRGLDRCLELASRKDLDVKVLLYQDYFLGGFDTRLFDYLLTKPNRWWSVTLTAPRARHGWNQVHELADKLWHSAHWQELGDMQIAAGTCREIDNHQLPLIIQRIGSSSRLSSLDFGFNMGQWFDWSLYLSPPGLSVGVWHHLRHLHLKHSSSAALAWLLRACQNVEVVYAGLTVDQGPTWDLPKIAQHTALREFGVWMITTGTDAFDLHTVFDGLRCPNLSVMAIGCAPGLGVGFQDDRFAESVVNFLDRSGCTLKAGCIHCTDAGFMEEEWEEKFYQYGLNPHGPPDLFDRACCCERYWGIDVEDWYWGVAYTLKELSRTW
ncbi:hypothetical protein AAF712_015681 [Marasmius tenuissimus]|uniref:Uncharacterized protein n=1 Tax=Marasmius tenuissimus TaxID=585030 RepID=A0ABR2Z8Q4_9AGAR